MAFHDPIDAISWALDVQCKLLLLPWPEELLDHADAKEQYTPDFMTKQTLLFKGLRVRMAMHTGKPDAIQVKANKVRFQMTTLEIVAIFAEAC